MLDNNGTYCSAIFKIKRHTMIIGLTGFTSSGCSRAAGILKSTTKPIIPPIHTLEDGKLKYDVSSYKRIDSVWSRMYQDNKWEKFVCIEVAYIVFLIAACCIEKKDIQNPESKKFKDWLNIKLGKLELSINDIMFLVDEKSWKAATAKNLKKMRADFEKVHSVFREFKDEYTGIKDPQGNLSSIVEMLQSFGNDIREYGCVFSDDENEKSPDNLFVIPEAIRRVVKLYEADNKHMFVIDSFRNPFEIEYFKHRFSEFYLVAVLRDKEERNNVLMKRYLNAFIPKLINMENGLTYEGEKNKGTHKLTKINIIECEKRADYYIYNDNKGQIKYSLIRLICLKNFPGCVPPTKDEKFMQIAMTIRQNSGCISRKVGAVVVSHQHDLIGVGWNDAPNGQVPCLLRTRKELCEKNEEKFSKFENSEPFRTHIGKEKGSTDDPFCFKDEYAAMETAKGRKAEFSRSLHAEENAFLRSMEKGSSSIKRGTLYTTDRTCNLCAKKAFQLGISRIVYIDEYSDDAVEQTLTYGKEPIINERFIGITGSAYFRLFSSIFPEKDVLDIRKLG